MISYLQYKFGDTTVYSIVNEEPNAEECKAKFRKQGEEDKSQINIRLSRRAAEDRSRADRCVCSSFRSCRSRVTDVISFLHVYAFYFFTHGSYEPGVFFS